jgi:hypothetical protein
MPVIRNNILLVLSHKMAAELLEKDGKIKLPAWAISNGTKGVIEPLPLTVDASIKRLEEFK